MFKVLGNIISLLCGSFLDMHSTGQQSRSISAPSCACDAHAWHTRGD